MRIIIVLLVLVPAVSLAVDYSFQQEWLGGPGVPGPVTCWIDEFHQSEGIAWWRHYPEPSGYPVLELNHYKAHSVTGNFESGNCLMPSDFDNDGDNDLVACSGYGNMIHWWENLSGNGCDWQEHSIDDSFDGCFFVHTGDIDGDGFCDVASASRFDDQIAWWKNPGTGGDTWVKTVIQNSFDLANLIYLADLDGDNDLDAVSTTNGGSEVFWFENMDGAGGTWTMHLALDLGSSVKTIDAVDIDGDGHTDILVKFGNAISWLDNTDGTGSAWSPVEVSSYVSQVSDIHPADMDGDGDLDILTISSNFVHCWQNINGIGTAWLDNFTYNYPAGGLRISAGDIDGDGEIDAVAVVPSGYVKKWSNIFGGGTHWERDYIEGGFSGAANLACADFTGDGIDDVAAISSTTGNITCWNDTAYTESGWLESSIDYNWYEITYAEFTASYYEPPGTSVSFQLRASDDPQNMGEWSDYLTPPCDLQDMFEGTKYLQYRVSLSTADPELTPALYSIWVHYYILGIEDQPGECGLLGPDQNPGSGVFSVDFAFPCPAEAGFRVYDMSGRVTFETTMQAYEPGLHSIELPDLPAGVYTLRMTAGEFTESCRIVRLD